MDKIIDVKLKIIKWKDILENENILFNVFTEFEKMNLSADFPYDYQNKSYPYVRYNEDLIINETLNHIDDTLNMFASIRMTDKFLNVNTLFNIHLDESDYDRKDFNKRYETYKDIWMEQRIRLEINGKSIIEALRFTEKYIHDPKEALKYVQYIKYKYRNK